MVTIVNSIVAGNLSSTGKEIYRSATNGLVTSLGHNLFGENGVDGLVNVTKADNDLVLPGAIATALGPLADNGGPTPGWQPPPARTNVHGNGSLIERNDSRFTLHAFSDKGNLSKV